MHWIQDCFRCNDDPDHTVFDEDALVEAQSCAQICKSDLELVNTNTKAANPGKFKDERKWPDWSKAFINLLTVILGVTGIPLAYVVRNEEEPDDEAEYVNFNERMIDHAPHTGQYYLADSRRVHNLLTAYLHGELTKIGFLTSRVTKMVIAITLRCTIIMLVKVIQLVILPTPNAFRRHFTTRASVPFHSAIFFIHFRRYLLSSPKKRSPLLSALKLMRSSPKYRTRHLTLP
jgi:hypothetical protein